MSEVDATFSRKKILRVFQRIQTVVEYVELEYSIPEEGFEPVQHTETKQLVVDSHDRPLPDPEPVEVDAQRAAAIDIDTNADGDD